jgi:hypothetical protein
MSLVEDKQVVEALIIKRACVDLRGSWLTPS